MGEKGTWGGGNEGERERDARQRKRSTPKFTININDQLKKAFLKKVVYLYLQSR